jgi:hypothetical protein
VTGLDEPDPDVTRGSETGRVRRGRDFEGLAGVFAATETGLYHSDDGDTSNLDVPGENVYAVGASPDSDRLSAGTRPANVYDAHLDGEGATSCGVCRAGRRYLSFKTDRVDNSF